MAQISKNKPCPCGKPKLYKRCCGKEKTFLSFLDFLEYGVEKFGNVNDYLFSLSEVDAIKILESMKNNRELLNKHIRNIIEEAVELINQFDKIFILGGMSSIFYNQIFTDRTDDARTEVALEYCMSICTTSPNSNKGKLPNVNNLEKIHKELLKIRDYIILYFNSEDNSSYTKIESKFRKKLINETLLIRGSGYSLHLKNLFQNMFSLHDEFFEKEYGFKAIDILDSFEKIEENFSSKVIQPDKIPTEFQTTLFANWIEDNQDEILKKQISPSDFREEFLKANPQYELNNIADYSRLYEINFNVFKSEHQKVIETLSVGFGENEEFLLKKIPNSECNPLNESVISKKPFIKEDNRYFVFSNHLTERNVFKIAIGLIEKKKEYFKEKFIGNQVLASKDNFMERHTCTLFERMLPNVKFLPNAKYIFINEDVNFKCDKNSDGNYEIDLIGISETAIYLIEVKAGLVNNSTLRGGVDSIKSDLKNIIGKAICQSYTAHRYILEADEPKFTCNKEEVILDKAKKIFKVCISFSYVGNIISSLNRLKELEVISSNNQFSWVLNILNLYVFAEFIESEEMFIDFLEKRNELYKDSRIEDVDEIAILSFYFHNDMRIDPKHSQDTKVIFNRHYVREFDEYYQKGGLKPSKKK